MKLIVDQDACIGAGHCVQAASAVFDQREEDGVVVLRDDSPPPDLAAAVRHAAGVCPALAITIEQDEAGPVVECPR